VIRAPNAHVETLSPLNRGRRCGNRGLDGKLSRRPRSTDEKFRIGALRDGQGRSHRATRRARAPPGAPEASSDHPLERGSHGGCPGRRAEIRDPGRPAAPPAPKRSYHLPTKARARAPTQGGEVRGRASSRAKESPHRPHPALHRLNAKRGAITRSPVLRLLKPCAARPSSVAWPRPLLRTFVRRPSWRRWRRRRRRPSSASVLRTSR